MKDISLTVRNRQRKVKVDVPSLTRFGEWALRATYARRCRRCEIVSLDAITVMVISDARMTAIHGRFSGLPTPTDVLTFQHGDILVSAETAQRQAQALGTTTEGELRLYLAHAFLHLCGYDDREPKARARMRRMERQVLSVGRRAGV